ncbi:hypothetical protein CC86DRAFT_396197 [Ophiobolus disseminans]|uniref:PIN domain-containing protein n=1 Tax=Ophiobolus disseminans TaxID=1469910 RepID=A0A6A6ZQM6_9PLEO|nr:hypothetical protein CC86DRAFT_396197 [Ophiobolus disseminans]
MRRSTFPPRAAKADVALRAPEPPTRKIFNCIVDDTALIAGVKKSTRDGIRKWVSQGSICLYVPLHTLGHIQCLKTGTERVNADSREAVKWLDDITSVPGDIANRVRLQGGDEEYPTWAEVEKFLLPETLLSMEDSESEEDDYHEDLESSFNALDVSDESSISSTHSMDEAPKTPESPRSSLSNNVKPADDTEPKEKADSPVMEALDHTARNSSEFPRAEKASKGAVPAYLQPLFRHILWRINKEENPDAALESFILLTNDPTKQAIAQKFGIRVKRLEQLRDAVAREDREYRNHLTIYQLETQGKSTPTTPKTAERPKSSHTPDLKPIENSDDEDVVLFRRVPPRGPAATMKNEHVIDPNDFGRANPHHSPRGGRGGHIPPRGRGGPLPFRGRGNFAARGAYVPPGPAFRPPPAPRHDPNQPLDPNSFTRPAIRANPVRGGHGRKLWEPN